jgi:2-dehydro-3-deoxy-D-arabinonate dehydratase
MILLHAASDHLVAVSADRTVRLDLTLDALFVAADPAALLRSLIAAAPVATVPTHPRAPLQSQEVWAAGVTYFRSMTARKEESKDTGGGTFYDRVYHADRPELFFKSTPHRVAAPGTPVRIRADSKWNVPEPELTLAINSAGKIFGYTIGNDMSSRDIEGENPLYLPQAKVYDRSAALGSTPAARAHRHRRRSLQ